MSTTKEKIEIMQAALDGGDIEFNVGDGWVKSIDPENLEWEWAAFDYRIKTEPIECWVNVLDADICSTVFQSQHVAIMALENVQNPERWTTRKFREVIE